MSSTSQGKAARGPHAALRRATLVAVPLCLAFALLGWLQMRDLDDGIVDAYARQQDSYVGIVLNEIKLSDDRSADQIVNDILGTLDGGTSGYWALSRGQTMLYVKDVAETNRYKEVSASTYFDSSEAEDFLNGLATDRVTHRRIRLGDRDCLASGIKFSSGGSDYRLCLITNVDVLLASNEYMGARARLGTLWAAGIVTSCVGALLIANNVDRRRRERDDERTRVTQLSERMRLSEERIRRMGLYDALERAWSQRLLIPFVRKLHERGVNGSAVVRIDCGTMEQALDLLEGCSKLLGDDVLRFHDAGECMVTLLFAHGTPEDAASAMGPLVQGDAHIVSTMSLDDVLASDGNSGKDPHDED